LLKRAVEKGKKIVLATHFTFVPRRGNLWVMSPVQ
jgi:hypothetical protein